MSTKTAFGNTKSRGVVNGTFKAGKDENVIATINTSDPTVPEINLGNVVAFNTAVTMKNLSTTKPLLGIETSKDLGLKKLLDRSDFSTIYPRLEMELAYNTGSAMLGLVYINKVPFILLLKGTSQRLGTIVTSATGMTESVVQDDGYSYTVGYEWRLNPKNGKVQCRMIYEPRIETIDIDGKKVSTGMVGKKKANKWKNIPKEHKHIPVEPFVNNEYGLPDRLLMVQTVIDNLNYHSNQTKEEWEFTKTQLRQNSLFNGDTTAEELAEKIKNGQRIHSINGTSSKLRDPVEPFVMGSPTLMANIYLVDGLEDKATKYLFGLRDSIAGGTNKHNTEVATFNQVAAEMTQFKMERFRNKSFDRFFKKSVSVIKGINLSAETVIKMQLSTIETNKINTGDPTVTQKGAPTPTKANDKTAAKDNKKK